MRYAIYYTPLQSSPWHELGSRWLGRDVYGEASYKPVKAAVPYIYDARRYGFHATLKAPFSLRDGTSLSQLLFDASVLAESIEPFELPSLEVSKLHGFVALRPLRQSEELTMLEKRLVCELDSYRAPPTAKEVMRRNLTSLSASQKENFKNWGYPYVLGDFHFHMTLSCHLHEPEIEKVAAEALSHFSPVLEEPLSISTISIFHEAAPGADFTVLKTLRLGEGVGI